MGEICEGGRDIINLYRNCSTGSDRPMAIKVKNIPGADKLEMLLAGIKKYSQSQYCPQWRQWVRFRRRRREPPWVTASGPGWDALFLSYISRIRCFLKNKVSAITTQMAAIRHTHLLSGYTYFSTPVARYKTLIPPIRTGVPPSRNLPLSPDLLFWTKGFTGTKISRTSIAREYGVQLPPVFHPSPRRREVEATTVGCSYPYSGRGVSYDFHKNI